MKVSVFVVISLIVGYATGLTIRWWIRDYRFHKTMAQEVGELSKFTSWSHALQLVGTLLVYAIFVWAFLGC